MGSSNLDGMRISIVIPVYNGGNKFNLCLESLSKCSPPPEEVIVVADGDSDGSWKRADGYGFRSILLEKRGGPARARNHGAESASGDYLFFIDADVTVDKNIIDAVHLAIENHPDADAIVGSYDDSPCEPGFVSQFKNLQHHYVHQNANEDAKTFWGACGIIKRSVFNELGGFDESYNKASIEDIAFGYRLIKAGYKIRLVKELQVKHLKEWTFYSLLKTDIFLRAIPWTQLILQEKRMENDLNLSWASRFSTISAFFLLITTLMQIRNKIPGKVWLTNISLQLYLNRSFLLFLFRRRGFIFTVQAFFLHWIYYLYSGSAFIAGMVLYQLQNKTRKG